MSFLGSFNDPTNTSTKKVLFLPIKSNAENTKDFSRLDNLEKEFDEIKKKTEEKSHFEPYEFPKSDEAN